MTRGEADDYRVFGVGSGDRIHTALRPQDLSRFGTRPPHKVGKRGRAGRPNHALANYHLLPSVRGDLLVKLGRYAEAREELQRAIAMTDNVREHELLSRKLKTLGPL